MTSTGAEPTMVKGRKEEAVVGWEVASEAILFGLPSSHALAGLWVGSRRQRHDGKGSVKSDGAEAGIRQTMFVYDRH